MIKHPGKKDNHHGTEPEGDASMLHAQIEEERRKCEELGEELARAKYELADERTRWRQIVEGIADEIWLCDAQGRMSLVNLPSVTHMGLKEFQGKSVEQVLEEVEILNPDGKVRLPEDAPLLRSLRGEIVRGEEIMRHRSTGITRWRQFSSAPMRDENGKIIGAVAVVRDINEQKQLETEREKLLEDMRTMNSELAVSSIRANELQEEAERRAAELDATISSIPDGVLIYDPSGAITQINQAAQNMLGYNSEDFKRPLIERGKSLHPETIEGKPYPVEKGPPARASREKHDIEESYRLGANNYVQKPVDYKQFAEVVKQLAQTWLV